jgi:two-component system, cell cycle response regulator CtrA
MRRARCDTPVLVLCGISHTAIKVRGLQACADDFVTKPFNRAELIARMQAVIRRTNSYHTQPRLSVGKLRLDLRTRQFTFDGQPIYLTVKENMILELLAFRQDTPVTRKELIEHLYGGIDEQKIQIVNVCICNIRKKLSMAGGDNLIATVWGQGYRLRDPSDRKWRSKAAVRGWLNSQHDLDQTFSRENAC